MGAVVVVEGDRLTLRGVGDIPPVPHRSGAVVLVPGLVDGGLELIVAGRDGVGALPDQVLGVQRELSLVTARVPVAGAAHLGVEVAGNADVGGLDDRADTPAAAAPGLRVADDAV